MPNPLQRRSSVPAGLGCPFAVAAGVGVVVAVALGIVMAGTSAPSGPDRWAADIVSGWWPAPGTIAYAIDFVGRPWVVVAIAAVTALLAVGLRRRRLAVVALVAPAVTGLVATIAKPLAGRTIHGTNLSYPSGHVAAATTLAGVLALLAVDVVHAGRVLGMAVFLIGALASGGVMAVDQVAISAHYPTDALGGLATAIVVVVAVATAVDRAADRLPAARRLFRT